MPLDGGFSVTGLPGFKLRGILLVSHSTRFKVSRAKGLRMAEQDEGSDVPLGLATVEQMVTELGKRHTCVILATDGEPGQPPDQIYTACFYQGSTVHAAGLCDWLKEYLIEGARTPNRDLDLDEGEEG